MPKPEPLEPRHGVPVCGKCKTHAAWIKSKRNLCWWCEGEPPINQKLSPNISKEKRNDVRQIYRTKQSLLDS